MEYDEQLVYNTVLMQYDGQSMDGEPTWLSLVLYNGVDLNHAVSVLDKWARGHPNADPGETKACVYVWKGEEQVDTHKFSFERSLRPIKEK